MSTTPVSRNKQTIDAINRSFAYGDTEAFLAHCAEDIVWTMIGQPARVGKEAIRAYLASAPGAAQPTFSIESAFADDSQGASRGTTTMMMINGQAPSTYAFADFYEFEDGRVRRMTTFVVPAE